MESSRLLWLCTFSLTVASRKTMDGYSIGKVYKRTISFFPFLSLDLSRELILILYNTILYTLLCNCVDFCILSSPNCLVPPS